MKVIRHGQAGTLESSDALIIVSPQEPGAGLRIEINSIVKVQFGEQIRGLVKDTLVRLGVRDAHIIIQDRGALDYCLRARLEAAVALACRVN